MKIKKEIERIVERVKKMHGSNPFTIAKEMGITVLVKNLGNIKGFFKKILRRKFIFINEKLNYLERMIVCSHELGHAILHHNEDMQLMMIAPKLYKKNLLEDEANEFARLLLKDYYYCDCGYVENIEKHVCEKIISWEG